MNVLLHMLHLLPLAFLQIFPPGCPDRFTEETIFPVRVSENHRYLVDRQNHPFFIHADTPWSLIVALDSSDADHYLQNRAHVGFNMITVNLIEHWFNGDTTAYPEASKNRYGEYPFLNNLPDGSPDFTSPNEKYFAHADRVLEMALEKGMLVLLAPAYMGYAAEGLQEGWYREVLANGRERCLAYGRYLGKRYAGFPNLIWLMDGDRNPDSLSRPLMQAMVDGIRESDKVHLFTTHNHPTFSSRDQWEGAGWLDLNCVYTYDFIDGPNTVHQQCLRAYRTHPPMPAFLFETRYENMHNTTALLIRSQMYWGWLCAIAGTQLGILPVWYFGEGWKNALHWQGSCDAALMKKLALSRNWFRLVPDDNHVAVYEGIGEKESYVAAALADNGETLIAYIPLGNPVGVDLSVVSGSRLKAWWFNPQNGLAFAAGEYTVKNKMSFTPPDKKDWVLVVDNAELPFGPPGKPMKNSR